MKIGRVADPFQCYYLNPHRYTTVQLMKWTKRYLEVCLHHLLKQFESCLDGTEYGIIAASRIPKRTRATLKGKKIIRLMNEWYLFLPIDRIKRLEHYEKLREARRQPGLEYNTSKAP